MIFTLEKLTLKTYNKTLFSNISVTLLPGSITLLKGANGVGKSTLLRIIAGISASSSGRVLLDGLDVINLTKPYVNYIGHNIAIKPELTVIENVTRAAELYNSHERVAAAIHYFALNEYAYDKCYKLSAGNQKKVALSRLLACDAKIWLLDEAEANLDRDNRQLLKNCIYSKVSNGGIVIAATHLTSDDYLQGQVINLEDFKI
jgi:heme exporter protein A